MERGEVRIQMIVISHLRAGSCGMSCIPPSFKGETGDLRPRFEEYGSGLGVVFGYGFWR